MVGITRSKVIDFFPCFHLSQTTSNSCLPKELRSNSHHSDNHGKRLPQNPALTFLLNCAAVQRRRVIAQAAAAGSQVAHGYNFTSSDQSSTSQRSTSPEKRCKLPQNLRNLYENNDYGQGHIPITEKQKCKINKHAQVGLFHLSANRSTRNSKSE